MIEKLEDSSTGNNDDNLEIIKKKEKKINEYQFCVIASKEARRLNNYPDELKAKFLDDDKSITDKAIERVKKNKIDFFRTSYD